MDPVVDATDVSVVLDGEVLLPPTSLRVHPGTSLAIRGRNGSGKTTLLRVLAGLMGATSGTALVGGRPVDERTPAFRRTLAALIGPPAFARDLTVREHLRFIGHSWGLSSTQADASADELLERLGLTALAARFAHELSSGQLQLFSLAVTLARPCDVLLLDEPEQRLDADRREMVAAVLRERVTAGCALIFSSHNGALISALAENTITVAEP
ncbi:MAG TPA: ABC transporter ATP-binding protein [Glaciihabitans sp.]|jgi:ABC-type multidrug transport system ATPase subunit|nr:ABC transporter ATP-binding protein [Glaciihabitans sp.]